MWLKYMMEVMMFMSRNVVIVLKKYLKIFEDKGLMCIKGESISPAEGKLVAASSHLNEVGSLPDKTLIDILNCLTKCSVEDFLNLYGRRL